MGSLTRDQLQTRLDAYLAAELKILTSQEYTVGEGSTARTNKRAELAAVQKQIQDLSNQIAAIDGAASGQRRVYYGRPAR
jgi:ribonuclease HI